MTPTSYTCSEKTPDAMEKTVKLKFAFKMTSMIVRKFHTLAIKDDTEPPFKKAKYSVIEENNIDIGKTKHEFQYSLPYPMEVSFHSENKVGDLSSKKLRYKHTSLLKADKCRNLDSYYTKVSGKRRSKHRKIMKLCHMSPANPANHPPCIERSPVTSAGQLSVIFDRCVNFALAFRSKAVQDIDIIVRKFSTYGTVSRIQDHWTLQKGTVSPWASFWTGALVTYKHIVNFSKIFKDSFIAGDSTVIPVSVPLHLSRIGRIESQLNSEDVQKGTEIFVEGLSANTSWHKIRKELNKYGTVLYVLQNEEQNSDWINLRVGYRYTVEAFAASLALDGKFFCRSILHAKMKMSSKEWKIHYKLCATYG
ncbi:uncharacterized protein LOC118180961 isoform X2 [Stegodyphus dumicola]|nr:uncharacterized protein LOC118180961 isoform X2 [Stegodyphus dumicola]